MSLEQDRIRGFYVPIKTRYGTVYIQKTHDDDFMVCCNENLDGLFSEKEKDKLKYKSMPFTIYILAKEEEDGNYSFYDSNYRIKSQGRSFMKEIVNTICSDLLEDFNAWAIANPQTIKEHCRTMRQRDIEIAQSNISYYYNMIRREVNKIHDIQKDICENFS